jgi:CDP-glucose 4,6-dehydratase
MAFAGRLDGCKVLVTGHTGFKGGWLCLWLHHLGARVGGYALPPESSPNLFELARVEETVQHVTADVRDHDSLLRVMQDLQPELVLHLAAQSLVRRSYREPKATFDTNVAGTVNLLETIRATDSVQAAVIVTSDKCYESREWIHGYREDDRLGGHDPYSASKGAAELVTAAFQRSFFSSRAAGGRVLGLATVRAGNAIGGGDWSEDRIVPDAMRAVAADQPLVIRNPGSVRPWQHVLEPLAGYLALAVRLLGDPERYSGAWNFGPIEPVLVNVESLVSAFFKRLGRGESIVQSDSRSLHETGLLRLSCDKAMIHLGWQPLWTTAIAIDHTADWYRGVFLGDRDARELSLQQIESYQQAAAERAVWWAG